MFSGAWRILWHTKDVLTLGFSVFPLVLFQNPTAQAIYQYTVLALIFIWIASVLYCIFTVHRSPYFNEIQKLKWLLFILVLPYFGALAWFLRVHREKRMWPPQTRPIPPRTLTTKENNISYDNFNLR